MIFAMNGAEFGAAAVPAVAALQNALVALGKAVKNATLSKLVIDGLIGKNTVGAANLALTTYTPNANKIYRTGKLSQAQVLAYADVLTMILSAEAQRRGATVPPVVVKKPTAKKATRTTSVFVPTAVPGLTPAQPSQPTVPVAYTPPSGIPPQPAGDQQMAIIKWAAIGLGVTTLAGIMYYMLTRRRGTPAMAGLGEVWDRSKMHLQWLAANNAYGVIWDDQLIRVRDNPMFFHSKHEALAALSRAGLKLKGNNEIIRVSGGRSAPAMASSEKDAWTSVESTEMI